MARPLKPESELKQPRRPRTRDRTDEIVRITPGPHRGAPLPTPPPAGAMPPEDSRLWMFVPRAVQQGEDFIQDDTREWFEQRGRVVQIRRDYPDHPRWIVKGEHWFRDNVKNAEVASEIHMLARISAGMPDLPSWVPVRMAIKQQQADLAYRLTKMTRKAFIQYGENAVKDFATRAPGQFLKFVASTFVPKKIEMDVQKSGNLLDPETADGIIDVLKQELLRREREAALTKTVNVIDYEPSADAPAAMEGVVKEFQAAAATPTLGRTINAAWGGADLAYHLKNVVDIMSPETGEPSETVEWD